MHRPCAFTAVALIAGTIAGRFLGLPVLVPAAVAASAFAAVWFLKKTPNARLVAVFAAVFFSGWTYYGIRTAPPAEDDISSLVGEGRIETALTGTVEGSVIRIPSGEDRLMYRFDLALSGVELESGEQRMSGRVRMYVRTGENSPPVNNGDMIRARARLYPVAGPTNPGQTDYRPYYERQGISARAYVSAGKTVEVIRRGETSWFSRALSAVRQRILRGLDAAFYGNDRGKVTLVGALLVGRSSEVDDETNELMRKTGTAHFLALSGLHVAIFGFFLWWTLALLPMSRNARVVAVMAGLVCYCLIGGASISLVRATIMGLLYLGAELFLRQRDSFNIIGAAAIVVVLISPLDVFSPGFQLSFAAVLSIVAFGPLLPKLRSERGYLLLRLQRPEERTGLDRVRAMVRDCFVSWMFVSVAAWLGVAPLVAYYFNIVTPFSALLNVLVFPGIWALLVLGILTAASSLVFMPAGRAFALAASLMIDGVRTIIELVSSLPLHFYVPNRLLAPFSFAWVVFAYLLLALIALRLRRPRPAWRIIVICGLMLVSLYLLVPWQPSHPEGLELTTLDVGRGSTFVLRTPDGTVLYDCGGGGGNAGRDIIAPYLWRAGVTAIDAIILSHSDSDHTGALAEILERFAVGSVVVSPYFDRGADGEKVLEAMRGAGVRVVEVKPGQSFRTAGIDFDVYAPSTGEAFGKVLSDNDTSLVLRAAGPGISILFTGDAESVETAMLLDSGAKLDSDILIIPHHGGKNPFVLELARRTGARFAVISGGYDQAVIAGEMEIAGLPVLTTQDCGAIKLCHDGKRLMVETFLER